MKLEELTKRKVGKRFYKGQKFYCMLDGVTVIELVLDSEDADFLYFVLSSGDKLKFSIYQVNRSIFLSEEALYEAFKECTIPKPTITGRRWVHPDEIPDNAVYNYYYHMWQIPGDNAEYIKQKDWERDHNLHKEQLIEREIPEFKLKK